MQQEHRRAVAYSADGISGWTAPELAPDLFEPVCMASLIRVPGKKNRIVFANPESLPRNDLRVRLSYDEGKTWAHSQLLLAGPSGYSDMAAAPDGSVYILYEQVIPATPSSPREQNLVFSRMTLEWLTGGQDRYE